MPHNNQQLAKEAEAAFGERWQRPLAEAMGVQQKQMSRWALGQYEISDEKLALARETCRQHVHSIMTRFGRAIKQDQEL